MKYHYLIIAIIVFIGAFLGSNITTQNLDWYDGIKLPQWTPDGSIISIAWTIIFILLILSIGIYYDRAFRNKKFYFVLILFIINLILNTSWSYLFFGFHLVGASILEMIILEITTICLIILIRPTSRLASMLLYPYAIWVGFATILAYNIFLLNT